MANNYDGVPAAIREKTDGAWDGESPAAIAGVARENIDLWAVNRSEKEGHYKSHRYEVASSIGFAAKKARRRFAEDKSRRAFRRSKNPHED